MYSRVFVIQLAQFYMKSEVVLARLPFHLASTFDITQYVQELFQIAAGRIGTVDMIHETELFTHLVGSDVFPLAAEEFIYDLTETLNRYLWDGHRLRLFYTQHHITFPNANVIYVREYDNQHLGMAI